MIIALGTNSIHTFETYIQKFISDLPSEHRLIFVTPYDCNRPYSFASKTTEYLRSIKNGYDFVTIADWAANVSSAPEKYLGSDKIHIGGNKDGINLFINTITSAIDESSNKNAKK